MKMSYAEKGQCAARVMSSVLHSEYVQKSLRMHGKSASQIINSRAMAVCIRAIANNPKYDYDREGIANQAVRDVNAYLRKLGVSELIPEYDEPNHRASSQKTGGSQGYDPYAELEKRASQYVNRSLVINRGVVRAEYLAHKLKSPGYVSRLAVAAVGAQAAIIQGSIGSKPDFVTDRPQALEKKGREFTATPERLRTSKRVLTGELHRIYLSTRTAYHGYRAAYGRFMKAHSAYRSAQDFGETAAAVGNMAESLEEMEMKAYYFHSLIKLSGIPDEAGRINDLSKAMEAAPGTAIKYSVGKLAGGLFPGGGSEEKIKKAIGAGQKVIDVSASEAMRSK